MSESESRKNPFPNPNNVNKEKSKEVQELIMQQFNQNGKIQFHDMCAFFQNCIDEKDIEKSKISAFFCTNVINSTNHISNEEKYELIQSMVNDILNLVEEQEN